MPGGFIAHFLLDAVPHFGVDDASCGAAVPDALLGLAALGVVAATAPRQHRVAALSGVRGACLPDLYKPGEVFCGRSPFPQWFDQFHNGIQRESPRCIPVELGAAVVLAAALRRLYSDESRGTSPASRVLRARCDDRALCLRI
jgi:hypothetical protein